MPFTHGRLPAVVAFVTILILAAARPALAQPIVVINTQPGAPGELLVHGSGFGPGLRVFLDLVELAVVSVNATEARVTLGAVQPGSHWLILYHPATSQFAQFYTTIGAVGPPGPPGPPGPSGGIVNQSSEPQDASFNISGTGSAATINAENVISMRGLPIVSVNGFLNMFVGWGAGEANTTGIEQAFFGVWAGKANTTGTANTFLGGGAGRSNTAGSDNTFVGRGAGFLNVQGGGNTFVGRDAGVNNTDGGLNAFFGQLAGKSNTTGGYNAFFGQESGKSNTTGNSNAFFGQFAGWENTTGFGNTYVGAGSGGAAVNQRAVSVGMSAYANGFNATAIGSFANANGDNATAIGMNSFAGPNEVGIGTSSAVTTIRGYLNLDALWNVGTFQLCGSPNWWIATCSSSRRYKSHIKRYATGVSLVSRLRPVSFTWKADGSRDLGFVAEEVASIEPRLVTRNKDGQVQGVKYDRITAVLTNAIQEQQAQIERQQRQIDAQLQQLESYRRDLEALKALVCSTNPAAAGCK